jgi:N-glycosylase/DNA lyase
MTLNQKAVRELKALYSKKRPAIEKRLAEFKLIWKKGTEEKIFTELAFCLLTPQSKAKLCWQKIESLSKNRKLFRASAPELARSICPVRFHNNKARYIVEARKLFSKSGKISVRERLSALGDPEEMRNWLVKNIKGLGMKEASHFLRNVGLGDDLAILDRHILRNLADLGVIPGIPKTLTVKNYLDIEARMKDFSEKAGIPLAHLDLLFWSKETGEIFK